MRIFVSWSGEKSRHIAEIFKKWIKNVIQSVDVYYSPDEITKGTRWQTEIAKELSECKVSIICLTIENTQSPWIMFEAGALSRDIDKSRICPLLFGIEPSDIQGPLTQFQSAKFNKEEMKKVVEMINNELGESKLQNELFNVAFEKWWPDFDKEIREELSKSIENTRKNEKPDRDILEEILTRTRMISMEIDRIVKRDKISVIRRINPEILDNLVSAWREIFFAIRQDDNTYLFKQLYKLLELIRDIIKNADIPKTMKIYFDDEIEGTRRGIEFLMHHSSMDVKRSDKILEVADLNIQTRKGDKKEE